MYALIAHDPINLVRAIEIDAENVSRALDATLTLVEEEFLLVADLLIDLETGEISRLYESDGEFKTHPSAYETLGVFTDAEFFNKKD